MKKGEILSEVQFYIVKEIKTNGNVLVKDDFDNEIELSKEYAEKLLQSAHSSTDTKKVTKTELAEIFISNSRIAMSVSYNKQVKEADVVTEIMDAYDNSTPKTMETAIKKAVKKGLEGEERLMIGRHYGTTDEFGRINFVDMEIEKDPAKSYDTRLRLVDPRTINWLIVNNVKYIKK